MTRELEEAMDDMCNVIEYYERKSRLEGEVNTTLKAIEKNREKNMYLSREEAMDVLEISGELKSKILDRLKEVKS